MTFDGTQRRSFNWSCFREHTEFVRETIPIIAISQKTTATKKKKYTANNCSGKREKKRGMAWWKSAHASHCFFPLFFHPFPSLGRASKYGNLSFDAATLFRASSSEESPRIFFSTAKVKRGFVVDDFLGG